MSRFLNVFTFVIMLIGAMTTGSAIGAVIADLWLGPEPFEVSSLNSCGVLTTTAQAWCFGK